jgi:TIR domain-containing protein
MPAEKISAYLSHSYRHEDRQVNEFFWRLFWANGVTFAVDPESEPLCIPYLELMMKRSAAFVGIVTRRFDRETYQCSPFMVFEHWLALRAQKARLVFVESGVPKDFFPEGPQIMYFSRQALTSAKAGAEERIRLLVKSSDAAATTLGHGLGKAGLLLGKDRGFRGVIHNLIRSLGFSPVDLETRNVDALHLSFQLDELDFIVLDTDSARPPAWLLPFIGGRFIPVIKLRSRLAEGRRLAAAPPWEFNDLLDTVATPEEIFTCYGTLNELKTELARNIERLREERFHFTSLEEGSRYFRSLGRRRGRVFISNSSEMNEVGRQLSRAFSRENIPHFHYRYQNNIELATAWREKLPERVRDCQYFLPLITARYWASEFCREEYDVARQQAAEGKLTIVPYFMTDSNSHDIPEQGRHLSELQARDQVHQIVADIDGMLTAAEIGMQTGDGRQSERKVPRERR